MITRRRSGFTLIEVLVALAVFGVLSVVAYMALGQTLANADMLGERMERLEAILGVHRGDDLDGLLGRAHEAVRSHRGPHEAEDDATMLALRVPVRPSEPPA